MPRIDEEVKQDVVDQLVWDERVNATQVNVEVHGGTVVLRGVTPSYWAKMAAVEDAELIPGVERVDDQLTIEWSGISPSDTNLRANVELALQWHPNLDASHMAIDVSDGVVTLSGSVPNGAALRAARNAAYYTEGVVDVQDNLVVLF